MKKIFFYILLCSTLFVNGQQNKPVVEYMTAVHFNPFALVQVDYTLLTGIEFRLQPGFSLVTEAGYIFASDYIHGKTESSPASGFMLRPSVRFFVNKRRNFYLQAQVFL